MQSTARSAIFEDMYALLVKQQGRKVDIVSSADNLSSEDGHLVVTGVEQQITLDGVTQVNGVYRPTAVCDEGVASKLGIPLAYVRRLRNERPDLYDANVNGWLHGHHDLSADPTGASVVPSDDRSFLLRGFKGDAPGSIGIGRALLSDKYLPIDHLDVLAAALDGVNQTGTAIEILSCDLTDRRMVVRIMAPEIMALAPTLLDGYRSPFSGDSGTDNPTVFAGFVIVNSETGNGASSIIPRFVVQVCSNGMTVTKDAMRAVHLGSQMEEGEVKWSTDTQEKQLQLITARTRDAVRTFLDVDYMTGVIRRMEAKAGKPIENPESEVKVLGKSLKFTDAQINGIFGHFIKGGQLTLGGVVNAITSYAQEVDDGDTAFELEGAALKLLGA